MQQSVPTRHWRDTVLSVAAILFGISAPLFFFGRAAVGIGLVLSLILAVVSGNNGQAWRQLRRDLTSPLGLVVMLVFICWLPSVIGTINPEKSWGTWFARLAMIGGVWYLMRLIAPKARYAWNTLIWSTLTVMGYCVLASFTSADILSLNAMLDPERHVDITRRLKPTGSFFMFATILFAADLFDRKGWAKLLPLLGIVAFFYIIEVSGARANTAGTLAAFAAVVVAAWFVLENRLVKIVLLIATVFSVVGILFWLSSITTQWANTGTFTPYLPTGIVDAHRQLIWQFAYSHVFDHPLTGWGINAAPWIPGADGMVEGFSQAVLPGHPHSWFMEIWLETGLVGLLPVVFLVVWCAVVSLRAIFKEGLQIAAPILAILAAYWFSGLFNYSFWSTWWFGVFVITLAIAVMRRDALLRETAPKSRRKTLIVVGEDWSFVSHRIGLARAALVRGDEVVVACNTGDAADGLRKEGFRVVDVPIARGGLSPFKSLKTVKALACLIRREQPDIIINVAIQCVVLSAFAGLLVGAKRSVNMIIGLGFLFVSNSAKARIVRHIVLLILRVYARCPSIHVIVQNSDDLAWLKGLGFKDQRLNLIRGSGVDISAFTPDTQKSENPATPKTAIFVARMLWSKGLAELIEAARILKSRNCNYRIVLVGDADPANPDSASENDLAKWQQEGLVEWLGKRRDIAQLLRQADLAVLPSWREGLPKSLLEAGACGLAMVATDVPGCREIVHHQENGLLVPLRDADALANAIEQLMEDDATRLAYGKAARDLVERELCDRVIIASTLAFATGDASDDPVRTVPFASALV
ncbi:glycosyltransferase [Thalassospira lucentensis]|uniref:glycosyltransferase n=1 Tax=Thalassospira lucentensis TaxID=168935 RepID=UPI00142D7F7E|nr:glycosyltransferase [Thalassospira lucentensis]NIZ01086.1 glycosyltransferase [Thalassospira lucentensis]